MNMYMVIAAYNEGKNISRVVKDLQKAGYSNIVVVDDGSRDNTFAVAERTGATVLQHSINRGQGASLKTGIDYAVLQGADIIVTFDADGQHRVEDLPAMIAPVAEGKVDITVGSRFLKKTKVPFLRKLLLKGSVLVVWLFYRMKMTDAHNGFRAMSRKAAEKIDITCDRMAHSSEIVEEIRKKNLKYREIPVTIRYTEETLKRGHGSYLGAVRILGRMMFKRFFMR